MKPSKTIIGLISALVLTFPVASSLAIAQGQADESTAHKFNLKTSFYQPQMSDAQLTNAIDQVDKLAQKQIDDNIVPGLAICVVHNDKLIFSKGYGVKVAGTADKIDPDTVFQLASLSKPLSSTVVAGLVGDGKLSWDSKVSDLDPAFSMYEPWVTNQLTVRDLFAHRSGLPDHAGDELEDIGYDRTQVLHRLRFMKPDSSFRAGYAYTNFGLTEGGVAAAKSAGALWEDVAESRLFKPLGMNSSSYRFADFEARPNKALGHVLVDGKWLQKYRRHPDPQAPAGGASASVADMAKWMRLQLGGGKFEGTQIIAETPLKQTHLPHMLTKLSPINGLPDSYGLGFNVSYDQSGRLQLGHSGAFSRGAATCFKLIPGENLGICVLSNAVPIGIPESLVATFSDFALYGKPTQDWFALFKMIFCDPAAIGVNSSVAYKHAPASPLEALPIKDYIGTYTNDFIGDVQIVDSGNGVTGSGMILKMGPKNVSYPLKHFDRDVFTYEADSEDAQGPTGVRFDVGADGKAASVLLEGMNEFGEGRLERKKH